MSVRVLIIDDQGDFRRLLARHIHTAFDSPSVAEYEPAARGRLPADFSGSAYDAVLLGDHPGRDLGIEWLRDLSRRNGFPPIIYLMTKPSPETEERAIHAGAQACLSRRKIDHTALIGALRAAQARRGQFSRSAVRVDEAARATRFGEASIRGFRYVSQLAESPVSSVYLAESERNGSKVALKVLHQPPDEGAGVRNFDRFLREYQIARRLIIPTWPASTTSASPTTMRSSRWSTFPLATCAGASSRASPRSGRPRTCGRWRKRSRSCTPPACCTGTSSPAM
jgi:DNA-binding NarL/FixJ family response regulator